MSLQKVVAFGRLGALKSISSSRDVMAMPVRNKIVVTPPRTPTSNGEKILGSVCIITGGFSIPVWVLWHIQEYKGPQQKD